MTPTLTEPLRRALAETPYNQASGDEGHPYSFAERLRGYRSGGLGCWQAASGGHGRTDGRRLDHIYRKIYRIEIFTKCIYNSYYLKYIISIDVGSFGVVVSGGHGTGCLWGLGR